MINENDTIVGDDPTSQMKREGRTRTYLVPNYKKVTVKTISEYYEL